MKIEIEMDDQAVQDLLTTALEGGSNYWYWIETNIPLNPARPYVDNLSEYLASGRKVDVNNLEDGTYLGKLGMDEIKTGTALMIVNHPSRAHEILCGDGDAVIADMWLQYVVMGEIVYG